MGNGVSGRRLPALGRACDDFCAFEPRTRRQIALLPASVLPSHSAVTREITAGDRFGASLPQQGRQRLLEIGAQAIARPSSCSAAPTAEKRGAEANPPARAGCRIFARPTSTGPMPAAIVSRRAVTMPHDTGAPVGELQILQLERFRFNLHGLHQKLQCTS